MADNHPESRLERAAESTLAKLGARIIVPLLLAIVGWFLVDGVRDMRRVQESQGLDIVQIKSDVRDVNTRLDAQVLRQVETNTRNLESHEQRIQRLERAARIP